MEPCNELVEFNAAEVVKISVVVTSTNEVMVVVVPLKVNSASTG